MSEQPIHERVAEIRARWKAEEYNTSTCAKDIKYLLDLVEAEQARWALYFHTPINKLNQDEHY